MRRDFDLFIISPSSYGDRGELLQYHRILMKTAAPTVLNALVQKAAHQLGARCNSYSIHERLEAGDSYLQKIFQSDRKRTLIFLTTKSFELPRTIDIAVTLKTAGFTVVLGGPGITLADWKTYQYLLENGLSFNVGEGECTVVQIVEDFLSNKLRPAYWQREYVDLRDAPLPTLPENGEHKQCLNPLVGFSTSEGCPFGCSFCCVTTLRGRNISEQRARDPEAVVDWIEKVHRMGHTIMLTDDNFRRSFHYERIKELLIKLNERLTKKLEILVQVDVSSGIEKEMPELARMGVNHAFVGMESLDPEVLKGISKNHNKPKDYKRIADEFRKYGILVNSGVIVGFPTQTPEGIMNEVREFTKILDLVSIFCASPFPGSRDYEEAVERGTLTTSDPNFYDTRHVCRDWFQRMTPLEAQTAYHKAALSQTTLRHRLDGNRSAELRWRNFRCNLYGWAIAKLGNAIRGYPYIFMMDGIPRRAKVFRPEGGFKGFQLKTEDLKKKTEFLQVIVG
jgi:hypothetical protein